MTLYKSASDKLSEAASDYPHAPYCIECRFYLGIVDVVPNPNPVANAIIDEALGSLRVGGIIMRRIVKQLLKGGKNYLASEAHTMYVLSAISADGDVAEGVFNLPTGEWHFAGYRQQMIFTNPSAGVPTQLRRSWRQEANDVGIIFGSTMHAHTMGNFSDYYNESLGQAEYSNRIVPSDTRWDM